MRNSVFNVEVVQHGALNLNRTIHQLHGLRFIVQQTGGIGAVDFNALMLQLTTSIALIAVATTVVDFLLEYVMPERAQYVEAKFDVAEVTEEHSLLGAVVSAATLGNLEIDEKKDEDDDASR